MLHMKLTSNLVWIDLEMTGLDPDKDVIVEIATVVTDSTLDILGEGPAYVIHQPQEVLNTMSPHVSALHAKSGLIPEIQQSVVSVVQAEQDTLTFLQQYCTIGTSPLCGNTVYQDRAFLRKYMPKLDQFLHYRLIDVSSVKELVYRWYPNDPAVRFVKKEIHRAQLDIYQSIAELKHYRTHFFR